MATSTTAQRCESDQPSAPPSTFRSRSTWSFSFPSPRPNQERGTSGSAAGSYQRDDSIGSSVKLTYSETSTAKPTVMPNWKKNRPMMPPMKATGTNTAMMVNVVAMTARPISAVASRAAVK